MSSPALPGHLVPSSTGGRVSPYALIPLGTTHLHPGLQSLCCPLMAQGLHSHMVQTVRGLASSTVLTPLGLTHPCFHHQDHLYSVAQVRRRAIFSECYSHDGKGGISPVLTPPHARQVADADLPSCHPQEGLLICAPSISVSCDAQIRCRACYPEGHGQITCSHDPKASCPTVGVFYTHTTKQQTIGGSALPYFHPLALETVSPKISLPGPAQLCCQGEEVQGWLFEGSSW